MLLCTLWQIFAPRVASCLHVLYKRVESCRKFFGDIVEFFGRCDAHKRGVQEMRRWVFGILAGLMPASSKQNFGGVSEEFVENL